MMGKTKELVRVHGMQKSSMKEQLSASGKRNGDKNAKPRRKKLVSNTKRKKGNSKCEERRNGGGKRTGEPQGDREKLEG
jgi:hypothetical protein